MRKKILYLTTIATIVLFGACNNEEALPETTPETGEIITLTAAMPEVDPTTRVDLTQDGKNINLTWKMDDVIDVVFVRASGVSQRAANVKVTEISTNGKIATFAINPPAGMPNAEKFDLYGVYGGGGINITGNNPSAVLPLKPGQRTSLKKGTSSSVQGQKDVMLYFALKGVEKSDLTKQVKFKHLGSLFAINVKNAVRTEIIGLREARLFEVNGNSQWAFNTGNGGQLFDLTTGAFLNTTTAGNSISFGRDANDPKFAKDKVITFWAWYPLLSDKDWPELKLEMKQSGTNDNKKFTTVNTKPVRIKKATAGKTYHFHAVWDGTNLNFTNDQFVVE